MNIFEGLICPVCSAALMKQESTLRCENRHCFDIASSGYVNLLKPGKKNNAKAGDSREMIRARTDFFESDAYGGVAKSICAIVDKLSPHTIIDAGCGEGYYTQFMATDPSRFVYGVDMSKFGCEHGAKSAKRNGLNNLVYCVGSIFELPFASESTDLIVNMFAPVADQEFFRVLKKGGHFVVAAAGIDHLDGLKSLLYDNVYKNEEKFLEFDGFELIGQENLKYTAKITGNQTIFNLFTMTPYYHRTCLEDKKKLELVNELETTVEVNFLIYRKI